MTQLISNVLMQPKPTDAVEHLTLIEKLEKEKNNWHDDGENNVHRVIDDCIDIVKQHEAEARCKMTDITITDDEFQQFIIYAERYAIGRMTYVPSEVNNIIRKYLPRITNNTLGVLIQDIESEAYRDMLGMDFDTKMWLVLLAVLKAEREKRKVQDETV